MMENENGMALTGHLIELRKRLIICTMATAIGFGFAYYYSEYIHSILTKPLMQALPKGQEFLVFTGVVEPFFIYFKVGMLGGIVIASPVILYEIWGFVAPALYREEKFWFLFIVLSSFILFVSGTLFAYFIVFPFGFKYLLSFEGDGLKPMLSMSSYFSMATKLLLAFGATFQLPLAMLVLSRFGIVSARQLFSWWRYALVLILIAAAILTPTPDIFNQFLMAVPLVVLYVVGAVLALVSGKKKELKKKEEEDADDEHVEPPNR